MPNVPSRPARNDDWVKRLTDFAKDVPAKPETQQLVIGGLSGW